MLITKSELKIDNDTFASTVKFEGVLDITTMEQPQKPPEEMWDDFLNQIKDMLNPTRHDIIPLSFEEWNKNMHISITGVENSGDDVNKYVSDIMNAEYSQYVRNLHANNWKHYVGYQPVDEGNLANDESVPNIPVYYLETTRVGDEIYIGLKKIPIPKENYCLEENLVGEVVYQMLLNFPKWTKWIGDATQECSDLNIDRIKNNIASNTRRGIGNIVLQLADNKKIVFYSGKTSPDNPIIVSKYNGKYTVVKHPDFDRYGFVVETSA